MKSDYKKTLGEARTTAANVLYPWQSEKVNEKVQTSSVGKQIAKSLVTGSGYGALTYDRMVADGYVNKGAGVVIGILGTGAETISRGGVGIGDYIYNKYSYNKKEKEKNNK